MYALDWLRLGLFAAFVLFVTMVTSMSAWSVLRWVLSVAAVPMT